MDIIIQEGVQTNERVNAAVAEPVVYMMDRYVVGGFYRIHADRGIDENLNAPGASYVPLAFADSGRLPQPGEKPGASSPNRFYMYGVIARLAMLAASYELEATDPNAEVYDWSATENDLNTCFEGVFRYVLGIKANRYVCEQLLK